MITEININDMPSFINHLSARLYLKQKYGELIVMRNVRYEERGKVYQYHFVVNKQDYVENFELERKGKSYDKTSYEESYQELEITDDGHIYTIEKGGFDLLCRTKQKSNLSDIY